MIFFMKHAAWHITPQTTTIIFQATMHQSTSTMMVAIEQPITLHNTQPTTIQQTYPYAVRIMVGNIPHTGPPTERKTMVRNMHSILHQTMQQNMPHINNRIE